MRGFGTRCAVTSIEEKSRSSLASASSTKRSLLREHRLSRENPATAAVLSRRPAGAAQAGGLGSVSRGSHAGTGRYRAAVAACGHLPARWPASLGRSSKCAPAPSVSLQCSWWQAQLWPKLRRRPWRRRRRRSPSLASACRRRSRCSRYRRNRAWPKPRRASFLPRSAACRRRCRPPVHTPSTTPFTETRTAFANAVGTTTAMGLTVAASPRHAFNPRSSSAATERDEIVPRAAGPATPAGGARPAAFNALRSSSCGSCRTAPRTPGPQVQGCRHLFSLTLRGRILARTTPRIPGWSGFRRQCSSDLLAIASGLASSPPTSGTLDRRSSGLRSRRGAPAG
jgi:hypothetical protein